MAISKRHAALLEARGLDIELLEKLSVNSGDRLGPDTITIPYYRDKNVVGIKYRTICEPKDFTQEKGSQQIFYNIDCLYDESLASHPVIVTEGEIDCWSALQSGFARTVSVPGGAPSTAVGERAAAKYNFLDGMPELAPGVAIILATDGDEPGAALRQDLAMRLGERRCKWVKYPKGCKDLNDVLQRYGQRGVVVTINRAQWIVGNVYRMAEIPPVPEAVPHDSGFPGLSEHYKLRLGDFCVVTGIPGMGKTAFVNDLACRMAYQHRWPVCFAAFEQTARDHRRLLRSWFGGGMEVSLDPETLERADQWIDRMFAFVVPDEDSAPTLAWTVERMAAAAIRFGSRMFVIDPWNELEHDRPDGTSLTEYVGSAIRELKAFAKHYAAHVIVVAHPMKLRREEGQYPVPTLYDISDCHSDDTEVLTDRGWLLHRDLTLADRVACFDLSDSSLRYETPTAIKHFLHDGMMANFRGPSMDILVTPNHRMVVEPQWREPKRTPRWAKGEWAFRPAREINNSKWAIPLTGAMQGGDEPEIMPLDGGYPMVPFLKFLGWWLAEGWVASRSIAICQQPGELQQAMRAAMVDGLGLNISEGIDSYPDRPHCAPTWRAYVRKRSSPAVVEWFIEHCGEGAAQKRIPAFVWTLSPRLKRILIEAIIDGDGYRPNTRRGTASVVTTSPLLRDGIQRLSVECGRPCSVGPKRQTKAHHAPSWQINLGREGRTKLTLRAVRHLQWVPYSGDVWCLIVPTGAYVTRRNGRVAITGNSAHWANKPDVGVVVHRKDAETWVRVVKSRYHDQIGAPGQVKVRYVWQRATYELSEGSP